MTRVEGQWEVCMPRGMGGENGVLSIESPLVIFLFQTLNPIASFLIFFLINAEKD